MKCFRFHVGVIQPPTSSYTKYTSLYIFDVLLPRQATNKFQVGDQIFDVFFFNVSDNLELGESTPNLATWDSSKRFFVVGSVHGTDQSHVLKLNISQQC